MAGATSVLVVEQAGENSERCAALALYAHTVAQATDAAWAEQSLGVADVDGATALVFPDAGGAELGSLLGRPFELSRFFDLSLAVLAAVGAMHAAGLMHRALRPDTILIWPIDGSVKLTGFGHASWLPRDTQTASYATMRYEDLPYIAPEQTGRMNRAVDPRTDIYALGVMFYQLLTGRLPFDVSKPLEWVHCHVAATPLTPRERQPSIPAVVSDMVMTMLAKLASDRYQSAAAIAFDLHRAQRAWAAAGDIPVFRLKIEPPILNGALPDRLYGRGAETALMLGSLDKAREGGFPVVVVEGQSGMGKSSLVREIQPIQMRGGGWFVEGKFDQARLGKPYSALAQALSGLVQLITGQADAARASCVADIMLCVGSNGRLLTDLADGLADLIGPQPDPQPLAAADAQRRLHDTIRRFIGLFASPEKTLILFIDDLQWCDEATFGFLLDLLGGEEVKGLLLVLAYRSGHVSDLAPLQAFLNGDGRHVTKIHLHALSSEHFDDFIAGAVGTGSVPDDLMRSLETRTGGNPFVASQLLRSYIETGVIFRAESGAWATSSRTLLGDTTSRELDAIFYRQLAGMAAEERRLIDTLACLGHGADEHVLALALQMIPAALERALLPAIRASLIERRHDRYSFTHDRVQEAAYAAIPAPARTALHTSIATNLSASLEGIALEETIFIVVDQFSRGSPPQAREQRQTIARLRLCAARRARRSAALPAAIANLRAAEDLLGAERWVTEAGSAFAIAMELAECTFIAGDLPEADAMLTGICAQDIADDASDRAILLRVKILTGLDRNREAVELGIAHLAGRGIVLAPQPTGAEVAQEYQHFRDILRDRSIEDLARLPLLPDARLRFQVDLLAELTAAASYVDENLLGLILLRIANLSMVHGNSPGGCFSYVCLNMVVAFRFGDYDTGYRFGQLALSLVERPELSALKPRALMCFGSMVNPWTNHINSGRALVEQAFNIAVENGDPVFAAYARDMLVTNRYVCGEPLEQVEREAGASLTFATKANINLVSAFLRSQIAHIRSLRGGTSQFGRMDGGDFTEAGFEAELDASPGLVMAAFRYWTQKLELRYRAGLLAEALEAAEKARSFLWTSPSFFDVAEFHLYAGLTAATALGTGGGGGLAVLLADAIAAYAPWLKHGSPTLAAQGTLLLAEQARLGGTPLAAMDRYEEALALARNAGFMPLEALVAERAAGFYANRKLLRPAAAYLTASRDAYRAWGAAGKVAALERDHVELGAGMVNDERPIAGLPGNLDQAALISALQALTTERNSGQLLARLMKVALASAGASRGVLFMQRGEEMTATVTASLEAGALTVRSVSGENDGRASHIAMSIAMNNRKPYLVEDVAREQALKGEVYSAQAGVRSLMAIPLLSQGKLTGCLYLENGLQEGAFTFSDLAMLELIAGQAAASIESVRLYENLAQENESRRRTEDKLLRSEAWLTTAQRISKTGSWQWHVSDDSLSWSDEAYRILALDRATAMDLASFMGRVHPDDRPSVVADINRALAERSRFAHEFRVVMPDGALRHIYGLGEWDAESERPRMLGAIMDVTERHTAEEAVRNTQSELAHAARLAMVGELASSIIHEINQPLAATATNAFAALRWLQRPVPDIEEAQNAIKEVAARSRQASDIVGGLRTLARKGEMDAVSVNVDELIGEVLPILKLDLHRLGVRFEHCARATDKNVIGRRVQIQQVVVNLCRNALEAMADAGTVSPVLTITTAACGKEDVTITVRDNGPGIAGQSPEAMFKPLYTTKPNGMGLGLAICCSIVEAHGGRLWSEPVESGACFHVTLPGGG